MEEITHYLIQPTVHEKGVVKAWEESIVLPTYEVGKPEKKPIFLENRVYQGSAGSVYPYAVIESVSDTKSEKKYRAVFIENEYLKIMILTELGGRIQMAYDKVKRRHFVYYNQVIKPALVGLTGPWISGGIEFNWPQHHRPTTFLPTDSLIEHHSDGSITVWCSEVERMFHTKGMQGFRIYPGKAYIEIEVKVYNRTPFPQTFLWWANPAVVVNEGYHSVFPPDVHAVFDHGKRAVSNFPIATGEYYKHDYSAGVDISKYKNIPVPTSYMAIQSKYDFVGGYEESAKAGLLHVANHHVSPGKKQWTWGNGDFGRAWDRNLTDEDGPYIELMTGVFTDNQPDFTWLQPNEEKSWVQYFMPYAEVGYVKNATKDALVNLELHGQKAQIILYTTSSFEGLRLLLRNEKGDSYLDECVHVSPESPYRIEVSVGDEPVENLIVELYGADGRVMLTYQEEKVDIKPLPNAAESAKRPKEIASVEELFLTGHHLEQYRHATYNPLDYYLEALNREPGDIRCNNAVGLLLLRKGKFTDAEFYLRQAVKSQTARNPNPYDGEPYYNLGWCLDMQGKQEEAYDAFYKSTWNAAWQDAGYHALARIDSRKGLWQDALDRIDRSLIRNWHNHKARQLKSSLLRKLGRIDEALTLIQDSLRIDSFNMGCRFEHYLLTNDEAILKELKGLMRGNPHSYLAYALDFAEAGFYNEASQLLLECDAHGPTLYPMTYYALAYFATQMGDAQAAKKYAKKAAQISPDGCFPNRIQEVLILQHAMVIDPSDPFAPYYLGNFWYAARQYSDAIDCWERSYQLNPEFPTVLRNLALAYYNKRDRKEEARELLERAFYLDTTDARLLMELDQLYKKRGMEHLERLAFLEKHPTQVAERDDLSIERITLFNLLGRYEEAKQLIASRTFHPWEGGEGKIGRQYTLCHMELAKKALKAGDFQEAVNLLQQIDHYPLNLGEGKLSTLDENELDYYKGLAYRGLLDETKAIYHLQRATMGQVEPQQAFFYNDQPPQTIYFQGLAWQALGQMDQAKSRFNKLINHGEKHLFDHCEIDYFAVSLPDLDIWEDDLNVRNKIHCYYVMGLGYLGLEAFEKAKSYFTKVCTLDVNHLDSQVFLRNLDALHF
ncbi:MAG: DUF5107 domain-containing protein [Phocaeicola sp.]